MIKLLKLLTFILSVLALQPSLAGQKLPFNSIILPAEAESLSIRILEEYRGDPIFSNSELFIWHLSPDSSGYDKALLGDKWAAVLFKARSGLPRDAHVFIACHELGHAIGGSPYSLSVGTVPTNTLPVFHPNGAIGERANHFVISSVEGQADYFSSSRCMKRIFKKDASKPHLREIRELLPKSLVEQCLSAFSNEEDSIVCMRSIYAGFLWLRFSDSKSIQLSGASDLIAQGVLSTHHTTQCRLDTVIAGALNLPRPKCWFNPVSCLSNPIASYRGQTFGLPVEFVKPNLFACESSNWSIDDLSNYIEGQNETDIHTPF